MNSIVPLVIAAVLLFFNVPLRGLDERFLPWSLATFWVGFALTAAGLLFTVWARHPIYTGLLLGFLGSAVAVGEWRGIAAVVLVGLALWRKLRVEERGMRQLFGERYLAYERHVSALIPFVF